MRVRKESAVMEQVSALMESRKQEARLQKATDTEEFVRPIIPVMEDDLNPIAVFNIGEGEMLFIVIFGDPEMGISINDLRTIVLGRRFPKGFAFNGTLEARPARRPPQPNFIPKKALKSKGKGGKGSNDSKGKGTPVVEASLSNINFIICPFMSTLVNMGALPISQSHTREQLSAATVSTGLPLEITELHINGNFANIPSGVVDLFNMEGNSNEHVSSTGISDCATDITGCTGDAPPNQSCTSTTARTCRLPNPALFQQFVNAVDTNYNGYITIEEINEAVEAAGAAGFTVSSLSEGAE